MLKSLLILTVLPFFLFSKGGEDKNMNNPFFSEYKTPFQTPPFDLIKNEHYFPAFEEGMKQQKAEVEAIINNPAAPTFENTIDAMEKSGELLDKVSRVFYALYSAHTNNDIQQISKDVAPLLSKHSDDISLNEKLFERIKTLYNEKDGLNLTSEQNRLLEKYYKNFVRRGANLNEADKDKLRKINEELSLLSLKFSENVLKETNAFQLFIDNEADLKGLPEAVVIAAAEAAEAKGNEGKWLFTLHKPSFIPYLQYGENREIREKLFKGYINRGDNNNDNDNKEIIAKVVSLRIKKANLLGYKTHADFILEENMAKTSERVYEFLNQIWEPALKMAKQEVEELQKMIEEEGNDFKLEAWDWWYYAEKLKKAKYDLDEEMLRPYFKLENVIDGVFTVANKLFGLQFVELKNIPVYQEEVKVFEVKDADGSHVGILFTDYFPRESKRAGAWMGAFRSQSNLGGEMITPVITNVGNFSKPAGDKPALLNLDEVNTLFHEFGHALHGLLSNVTYPSLSGTSVPRDFVELPSQIMENWATHPEVLKTYAKHYETGKVMPDELIEKIEKSEHFNMGFVTVEYLSAAFLDMDWHTLKEDIVTDVNKFDEESLNKIGMIPEIVVRYRSTYFSHIFSGGYSAGYYSYIWAEVLDSDAFEAFKEAGNVFDTKTAKLFRENVLSKGGTDDPMLLYKKFRGAEPKVEALLKKRGLN